MSLLSRLQEDKWTNVGENGQQMLRLTFVKTEGDSLQEVLDDLVSSFVRWLRWRGASGWHKWFTGRWNGGHSWKGHAWRRGDEVLTVGRNGKNLTVSIWWSDNPKYSTRNILQHVFTFQKMNNKISYTESKFCMECSEQLFEWQMGVFHVWICFIIHYTECLRSVPRFYQWWAKISEQIEAKQDDSGELNAIPDDRFQSEDRWWHRWSCWFLQRR